MRYPQLVLFDHESRLTPLLQTLAEDHGWYVREPRQAGACLRLLAKTGPNVLIIRLGHDLERELSLLDQASRLYPETVVIVVAEGDNARVAGLAWDLGASYVHTGPTPREALVRLAQDLMRRLADGDEKP